MPQAIAGQDLAAIDDKLEQMASQLRYLTEQAEVAARRQQARAELVRDVLPAANDAFELLTEQLEEVQVYVDLDDLLRLLKRLLRNGRNLDKLLDHLESLMDLTQTVGPLADDVFGKATDLLQKAEQKGYFAAARTGAQVVDDVVAELSRQEPPGGAKLSLWALARQLRDPDARRGLATLLGVLKVIGRHSAGDKDKEG